MLFYIKEEEYNKPIISLMDLIQNNKVQDYAIKLLISDRCNPFYKTKKLKKGIIRSRRLT
jgi:hypothetical protein